MSEARIEIDIDTGNTPMQKDEELYIKQEINRAISERSMKIKSITIFK